MGILYQKIQATACKLKISPEASMFLLPKGNVLRQEEKDLFPLL